jgi:hypothetical protein
MPVCGLFMLGVEKIIAFFELAAFLFCWIYVVGLGPRLGFF